MEPALRKLHDEALLACGRLDVVTDLLPDANVFLYSYVRKEAVLSSQIEGTQSSLSDLLLFELEAVPGVPLDDVEEVSNYVAALQHGMERLRSGFPLSNRLIREMHQILMTRSRGGHAQPGVFRKTQNWIGGTRPGNAHFVPPPPDYVAECMGALESFLHSSSYSPLQKAALAHVQFETIHPFLDGNGRTGRLLIAMLLHTEGVLRQPLLYLSVYFKKHRSEYYRRLDEVRKHGDWTTWLQFFLEGVIATSNNAVQTAQRISQLFQRDMESLRDLGRGRSSAEGVLRVAQSRPVLSVEIAASMGELAFPTANAAMGRLVEVGILREVTGNKRNRLFAYSAYLDQLNLE
jgi:Fic family protein